MRSFAGVLQFDGAPPIRNCCNTSAGSSASTTRPLPVITKDDRCGIVVVR